jgi:hypothetical protein
MKAFLFFAFLSLAAWLPAQKPAPAVVTAGNEIFALTKVHRIRISISAAEWAVLQTSGARVGTTPGGSDYRLPDGRLVHVGSGFGSYFPWAHADMRIDDGGGKKEFKDVGIRYKGNLSFSRSTAAAPLFANFKLKIDLHGAPARGMAKKRSTCTPAWWTRPTCATPSRSRSFARPVCRRRGRPMPS